MFLTRRLWIIFAQLTSCQAVCCAYLVQDALFSSREVLISLYFWIKEMFVSCRDLSPNRPFQELLRTFNPFYQRFTIGEEDYKQARALASLNQTSTSNMITCILRVKPSEETIWQLWKRTQGDGGTTSSPTCDWCSQHDWPRTLQNKGGLKMFCSFRVMQNKQLMRQSIGFGSYSVCTPYIFWL